MQEDVRQETGLARRIATREGTKTVLPQRRVVFRRDATGAGEVEASAPVRKQRRRLEVAMEAHVDGAAHGRHDPGRTAQLGIVDRSWARAADNALEFEWAIVRQELGLLAQRSMSAAG